MKYLIMLGLLFTMGCSREHRIICTNSSNPKLFTYNIVVPGNVYAFVVEGRSVLAYRDSSDKVKIILLCKNDCVVY